MLCQPYTSANLQFRELVVQIIAWPRPCHCQDDGTKSTRPDDRCPHCVYECGPWCGTALGSKAPLGRSGSHCLSTIVSRQFQNPARFALGRRRIYASQGQAPLSSRWRVQVPSGAILTARLLRPDSCQERSRQTATTFPGFMMFSGSMARLSVRINSTAGAPCSVSRYFIFFCPTPCSPVQVPFIAIARATRRSMNS